MKTRVEKLVELLGIVDADSLCYIAHPTCMNSGHDCQNNCPFLNQYELDETLKELKDRDEKQ